MKMYVSAVARRAALLAALVCAVGSTAYAQSLPSPWLGADIGSPSPSGSSTYSSGVFTINAGGDDIWNGSDQFRFVYQQVSGNVDIIARVDSLLVTDAYAKAGLMIRASLSASSAHGTAVLTGSRGIRYSRRLTTGASTTNLYGPGLAAPVWLRLTRVGSRVTTYYSTTGTSWTSIGYEDNIALGTTAYVGIAASSNNYGALTTAKVSNVTVAGQDVTAPSAPPAGLPDGQKNVDIGAPSIVGSTTYAAGTYTVNAAGSDIWGTSDQFHFVYRPITGNVEVVARVNSIALAHNWSKAGVMVRESLTGASRHASTFMSAGKGYAFQRRFDTGGHSVHTAGQLVGPPGWVRLVRTGDLFEAYSSTNGSTWTKFGSDTVPMNDTVYVGLAVTSHSSGVLTTAVMDNLRVTASTSPTNQPPAVTLTSPINGTSFTTSATVNLAANASDPENRLASVDFYAGSTLLPRDSTAPYSAAWSPSAAGTYALSAVAHDMDGGSTTSSAVTVTVTSTTTNPLPTAVAFTASTDHATNVSSYVLKIYLPGANTATATPLASSSLGKPTPDSANTITVDRASFFSALAAGSYLATVTAVGPGGSTASMNISFTR